jgi:hypothetical protein
MGLVYFGGLALVLGVVAAAILARSRRSIVALVLVGAAIAFGFFAYAWLEAPRNSEDADYSCSDCGQWLGRYWEGWIVLFFAVVNWIGWTLGVLAAAAMRRATRVHRELEEQRGAGSRRH